MAKAQIDLTNTAKAVDKYGNEVLKRAKRNLKIKKKIGGKWRITDNTGKLGKSLRYRVKAQGNSVSLSFTSSVEYASYIEQGVKGSGNIERFKSPYKFKSKNLPKGVVEGWIKSKKVKLRDKDGKFIPMTKSNIRGAAYVIGRSIAEKGIRPREYMQDAIMETKNKFSKELVKGVALDFINGLKQEIDGNN